MGWWWIRTPANDRATVTTTVQSRATLAIAKSDLFDPVAPGGLMFYRVTVTNTGPSVAKNLVVTDSLPPSVTFQSAGVDCRHDGSSVGGVITCTPADLGVNQRYEILVTAFAPLDVISGTVLTNQAFAVANNAAPVSATVTTTIRQPFVPPADLEVDKTGPATVVAGGQVTYTIVVTNHGPAIATGADLKEVLPAGVTLEAIGSSQGLCLPSLFGGLCQFGNIGLGEASLVTVTGKVNPGLADGTVLTNTAQVFANNVEPAPVNNKDRGRQHGAGVGGSDHRQERQPDSGGAG